MNGDADQAGTWSDVFTSPDPASDDRTLEALAPFRLLLLHDHGVCAAVPLEVRDAAERCLDHRRAVKTILESSQPPSRDVCDSVRRFCERHERLHGVLVQPAIEPIPDYQQVQTALGYQKEAAPFLRNGQLKDGLVLFGEAVRISRALAREYPERRKSNLATMLVPYSRWLMQAGQTKDALGADAEAVQLWRELFAAQPAAWRAKLIEALQQYSSHLEAVGKTSEVPAISGEVVRLRRDEFEEDTQSSYRRSLLADAMDTHADHLSKAKQRRQALQIRRESSQLMGGSFHETPGCHCRIS